MRINIVLIGLMGSGKTTLGQMAAHIGNRVFVDTDSEIVRRSGMTIPALFEQYGESHFRMLESEAAEAAAGLSHAVIATGGGMVKAEVNMTRLKATGVVIYLRCKPSTLYARIGGDTNRPLLRGSGEGNEGLPRLQSLLDEREPLYLRYSDYVLDTDHEPPEVLAQKILDAHTRLATE